MLFDEKFVEMFEEISKVEVEETLLLEIKCC